MIPLVLNTAEDAMSADFMVAFLIIAGLGLIAILSILVAIAKGFSK